MNKTLFLLIVAITAAWLLKPFFLPSEEDKILERAKELTEIARIDTNENRLKQLNIADKVSNFFLDPPLLLYRHSPDARTRRVVEDKNDLKRKVFLARASLEKAHCTYVVKSLKIEGEEANMELEAKVYWQRKNQKKKFYTIHTVKIVWRKVSGEWFIQSGENIPIEQDT